MKRLMSLFVLSLGLSGCTTMKAIETSGDEFSKGNFISGLWTGTMGIAMGALVDVFTLGGSTDIEQGAQTLTNAATQYSEHKTNGYAQSMASATPSPRPIRQPQMFAANPTPPPSHCLHHKAMPHHRLRNVGHLHKKLFATIAQKWNVTENTTTGEQPTAVARSSTSPFVMRTRNPIRLVVHSIVIKTNMEWSGLYRLVNTKP